MVLGHVEQQTDLGAELDDPFQLEAADFGNRPLIVLRAVDIADEGIADVPADKNFFAAGNPDPSAFAVMVPDGLDQ